MKELKLSHAFKLIEPGTVVLLTTHHKDRRNIMTMSWHMDLEFTPLIGCVCSEMNYSFKALRATKQCVIAIPGVDLIEKAVDIGNCSGKDVDKFQKFGLTPLQGKEVNAPLIKQCLANLECKVVDTRMVNKYNLFVLEGVRAWVDTKRKEQRRFHANGDGTFIVDGRTIDLKDRMTKWSDMISEL